ncbi:MAG TPA: hypothetical protein VJB56_03295 [Candidatus Paceibacterota bacterium]
MKNYARIGNRKGRPAYRTPSRVRTKHAYIRVAQKRRGILKP